jgi:hypothetical protein
MKIGLLATTRDDSGFDGSPELAEVLSSARPKLSPTICSDRLYDLSWQWPTVSLIKLLSMAPKSAS